MATNDLRHFILFGLSTGLMLLLVSCASSPAGPTPAIEPIPLEQATALADTEAAASPASGDAGQAPETAAGDAATAESRAETAGTGAPSATEPASTTPSTLAGTPAPSLPGGDLPGVVWQWTASQRDGNDTVTLKFPDRYTLEFLPGNQVRVRADCNRGMAVYTPEGGRLSIDAIDLSNAACHPQSKAEQFEEQLTTVVAYTIESSGLTLALESGERMAFTAASGTTP